MINDIEQFSRFIKCLKEAQCLGSVILVGSWSEFLYETIISNFSAEMATVDLDFLIPDLHQPEEKKSISAIAKQYGFEYSEKGEPAYTIFIGQDGFEVEFLSEKRGDGLNQNVMSNIGVKTQQLRHVHLLQNFTRFVKFEHMTIRVPEPEAYCLQKMIINAERIVQGKTVSDQKKINNLVPHLNSSIVGIIYETLTENEKKQVNTYITKNFNKQDVYDLFNIETEKGFIATSEFNSCISDIAVIMRLIKRNDNALKQALDDKTMDKLLQEATKLHEQLADKLNNLMSSTDYKEDAKAYITMQLSKQGIHSPDDVIDKYILLAQEKNNDDVDI